MSPYVLLKGVLSILRFIFSIHEDFAVGWDVIAFDGWEEGFGVFLTKAMLFLARECDWVIVKGLWQVSLFIEKKIKGKGIF